MERGAEGWKPLVELFGNVPDETRRQRRSFPTQIKGNGLADDFADSVYIRRSMAISSNVASAYRPPRLLTRPRSATKGVPMAGVDHGRQHVRADFTTPHCGADGIFQRLGTPVPRYAGLQTTTRLVPRWADQFYSNDEALTSELPGTPDLHRRRLGASNTQNELGAGHAVVVAPDTLGLDGTAASRPAVSMNNTVDTATLAVSPLSGAVPAVGVTMARSCPSS